MRARDLGIAGAASTVLGEEAFFIRSTGSSGAFAAPVSTAPTKRYPRRGSVSTKRGASAESPSASRSLLIERIHAVIEVHERVGSPQTPTEFFAGNYLSGTFQEDG